MGPQWAWQSKAVPPCHVAGGHLQKEGTPELGTTLQYIRSLIPLDYSYLLEVLCILFWESNSVQGPGLQSDQKHSLPANDPSPVARPATSRPTTSSPMALPTLDSGERDIFLTLFKEANGLFPV